MSQRIFNSERYFQNTLIAGSGFREYDARWVVEPPGSSDDDVQLNYRGLIRLGACLGQFLQMPESGQNSRVLVGHDFRSYAENVKNALTLGLLSSGIDVLDVGLCLTPMLYFAQYAYKVPACAMVTASHNANGWTGIKMASDYSVTFGPHQMSVFRSLVEHYDRTVSSISNPGSYQQVDDLADRYIGDLRSTWQPRFSGLPKPRVALETGNGTAGIVFPQLLQDLGFDLVPGHLDLDWTFPNFNPNPESIPFLQSVQSLVRASSADVGICIDGDGDRLGVIDDTGSIVFSDRAAVIAAKHLRKIEGPGKIVVDVKSTSLFDRELPDCQIIWEKTGHSYIKQALKRESALAGFERSGHFFFTPPHGRGYDDACVAALFLLWVIGEAKEQGRRFSDILAGLPQSNQSPTRQPHVPDEYKYKVVAEARRRIEDIVAEDGTLAGLKVKEIVTTNGVRVNFDDGSWLLIRASSNTPNLSVVAESFGPDGSALKRIDEAIRSVLGNMEHVGAFEALYEF